MRDGGPEARPPYLPSGYRLDETDRELVVLRRPDGSEAAAFLGLPYNSFREIAPSLPPHAVTPARFVYLRRKLLEWLSGR